MENHIPNQSFTIKQLSNKELLLQTKLLVQKERSIHIQVLRHLGGNRFPQAVLQAGLLQSF